MKKYAVDNNVRQTSEVDMTEYFSEKIEELLGEGTIQENDGLNATACWYVYWEPESNEVSLDGDFTAEELSLIAWWMEARRIKTSA